MCFPIRVASSTGWTPVRKALVKAPWMMPSRRRSNSFRIPKALVSAGRRRGAHLGFYQGGFSSFDATHAAARGQAAPGRLLPSWIAAGRVAELADAQDSGSCEGNLMGVQVPPR